MATPIPMHATRVIAFANQKGGVGKTTTVVNLGACLADKGRRVLILDLDPQANATSALGIEKRPGRSAYPALLGAGRLRDAIVPTAVRHLDLLPSELDLAGAEVEIARAERYLHRFQAALAPLLEERRYPFIFLDCPPSLGILTSNALAAAHAVIIPVQCEYLALEGLSMITRLIDRLREGGANPDLQLDGIVMTMVDGRTRLSAQVIDEVRRHFGERVYAAAIPRTVRLSEAPSFGQPILRYDPRGPGTLAFRALAREFLRRQRPPPSPPAAPAAGPPPLCSRERLRRAYALGEMDRPAVTVRTGFPADDPSYDALRACLQESADLRTSWPARRVETPPPTTAAEQPHSEDFVRVVTHLTTPGGVLEAARLKSRRGLPGQAETYFVKTRADAEAYLALPAPDLRDECGAFFEADRALGNRGIVQVDLGLNPAGAVVSLMGSEQFALFSVTDRDLLHALCQRQMERLLRTVTFLVGHGVGPFFGLSGEEYLTPPLHGPADFAEFNVRYDKPIVDLIHDAGGRVHVHCHGRVRQVFQGFLDMGADVLHPVEPPPMGDLPAAEAKALAGGRLCIEGNLQIAAFYDQTPDAIRAATEGLIRDAFGDRRGLIVCPTASPYVRGAGTRCLPAFQAMIEAVRRWTP